MIVLLAIDGFSTIAIGGTNLLSRTLIVITARGTRCCNDGATAIGAAPSR
jgi:hypothetical protein